MTKDEEKGYIERVLAGDESAYEPLVTENQTKVYRLALRILKNEADAEDDIADFVGFREDGNRAGRGVYAALRLGFRNTLYAMAAAFKLQFGISALAYDFHNDFFVAA